MFRWSFKHKPYTPPCHFLQQSLPSVSCPAFTRVWLSTVWTSHRWQMRSRLWWKWQAINQNKPLQEIMYSVFPYAICNLCSIFSSNGLSLFIALLWAKCRYCTWCKGLARRVVQLAYESALSSLYIKNSKHESLPSTGCLSWFMFYMRKKYHRKTVCISQRTSLSCPPRFIGWAFIDQWKSTGMFFANN